MERIIKRISVEAPQNAYTLYHTYIEFIEQPKLLGSTSYYANLIIKGTKCLIFHFDPGKNNEEEYMKEVISYIQNLFAILDSKFTDLSALSIDDKRRFNEWYYSDIFEKMYDWFNCGWLLKYSETDSGFYLLSNDDQFVLNCNKQQCSFEIKDTHPAQENNYVIQLKRNEGIYFLIAIKLLTISNLLYTFEHKSQLNKIPEYRLGCLNNSFKEYFLEHHVTFGHSRILRSAGIDIFL